MLRIEADAAGHGRLHARPIERQRIDGEGDVSADVIGRLVDELSRGDSAVGAAGEVIGDRKGFGALDPQGADYRACTNYGALYG